MQKFVKCFALCVIIASAFTLFSLGDGTKVAETVPGEPVGFIALYK